MKKHFPLFGIISLLCLFSCCDKKTEEDIIIPEADFITLNEKEINFEDKEGEVIIKLSANGYWKVMDIPEWISLNQTSGDGSAEITISVKENPEPDQRDALIVFIREDQKLMLKITQAERKRELSWSALRFSTFHDVSFENGENNTERIYNFSTRELFINPDKQFNLSDKIFLGNLINRRLKINTDIEFYEGFTFNNIEVYTFAPGISTNSFIPSIKNQNDYANLIRDKAPNSNEAFLADGRGVEFSSYRELHLIGLGNMGVKLDELVSGKSYKEEEMKKKNGIIYSFSQTAFSIGMEWEEYIVKEEIRKEDFPEADPSYISYVSYGRIGLLIIESNHSLKKLRVIVNKSFRTGDDEFSEEEKAILEELDAFHIYYDRSGELRKTKGKLDVIKAYENQITNDTQNIYPFRICVADCFVPGVIDSEIKFSIKLP